MTSIPFIDLKAQQSRIRPQIDAAIARVLDHGQYINGPEVAECERMLTDYCGAKHAIACASGTDALLLSLMALGVGPGDAVFCPAFTFTATPEAAALLGATPVFAEVDEATFNLDPAKLEGAIATAKTKGLTPKILMPVDLFGQPADYNHLEAIAQNHNLTIICDGAQSFGARYHGRNVGQFGTLTTTSFFPAKPLGCYGDGGCVFTDSDELAAIVRSLREHGKGSTKYDIARIGVNGRMDTIQAAILIEKLKIFSDEISARNTVAAHYQKHLSGLQSTVIPIVQDDTTSVWAQYTLRVTSGRREALVSILKDGNIPTAVYYPRPVHKQPAYSDYPIAEGGLEIATQLSDQVLSLPMSPYLSESDTERIATAVQIGLSAPTDD